MDKTTSDAGIFGGAELNVATALANWELTVKYCTVLHDHYLAKEVIEEQQLIFFDTSAVIKSVGRICTYYLPHGADLKNASVIYDRANSSFSELKPGIINWDTTTAVFDYGPSNDASAGFQVTFGSRMHNGDEKPAEIYYSNGGELNLITNTVSPKGGLTENFAKAMKLSANLLPDLKLIEKAEAVVASANTGADKLSSNHMRNFMESMRSRKEPNASVEAGYNHSIATIMTNAAVHTGAKVTFDEKRQEVMANGKVWIY
jgi:hypothetical protein